MTARTIPVNPNPGERWAELFRGQDWTVYEGHGVVVARHLSEADARLLVFGAKAVKSLRFIRAHECGEHPCPVCYVECRVVLADLEVPT